MFTAAQTLALANAFSAATGMSLYKVGLLACNNNKIFPRMAAGRGCHTGSLERAGTYFLDNWPAFAPWPDDVPRHRRRRRKAPCDGGDGAAAESPARPRRRAVCEGEPL